MTGYFIRRVGLMLLTLLGMSIVIFVLLRLVPGNIADILFDEAGYIDASEKARIEAELGLDRPFVTQYLAWMSGVFRGDLGFSYITETPVSEELLPRIPITLKLAGMALGFSVLIGLPLGVLSAVKQNSTLDHIARLISLSGLSMPSFWLALIILTTFVVYFGTIPIYTSTPESLGEELSLLLLPAAAVGFRASALVMRMTRSSMLEVLKQDYIRTARSKGAPEFSVNYVHALRNAVLPVTTIIGIEASHLIGGLIVTETVFNIPGIANYLVGAIVVRDYPVVQNLVMFIAIVVVVINFVVDMAYAVLDPRIRYGN